METIKVNMNPNPLDVQTIHASQNDGEARQWGFKLHNNGELIDTSDVTEQMFFKAYKGGTEQILPENGSVPTTSPFKGDIRYPQGLLSDQEFTYRQSPTEEDGLAKITDIKGNTLVWNQLVQNGNFESTSKWRAIRGDISASNNVLTYTCTEIGANLVNNRIQTAEYNLAMVNGHKYLVNLEVNVPRQSKFVFQINGSAEPSWKYQQTIPSGWNKLSFVYNADVPSYPTSIMWVCVDMHSGTNYALGDTVQLKNIQLFDLTKMGLDISSPSDFTSLFPLSYYSYNQGSLLSFMGNGIKTVGFNQWDEEWEVGAYNSADGSKADNVRDRIRNKNPIRIFPSINYYKNKGLQVYYYDANMNYLGWNSLANQGIFTPPSNACYMNFNGLANSGATYNNDICINISDTERNGTYESYTSSTLSLPISTYFPNGMKSAGNVYDELTESKAITRIGSVDLGSLEWNYTGGRFQTSKSNISPQPSATSSVICSQYPYSASAEVDKTITQSASYFRIYDSSYTDAQTFKTAMNGVMLYYELATSTETSFTTASLVTENAEIPLSNNDGVLLGKCTEQLSENPGFIDAKIKLSDDDGECYSNKLQLHVERSPQ